MLYSKFIKYIRGLFGGKKTKDEIVITNLKNRMKRKRQIRDIKQRKNLK